METWLAERFMLLIPLILSLSVHEWAHAWTANQLGDDTARLQGRLTLDPLAHIDPIGTLLLPMLGVPFGWAKPVPVNPNRFDQGTSMGLGMLMTAVAGPLSNLALAFLFGLGLALVKTLAPGMVEGPLGSTLQLGVFLNLALAVFNMLPIPPLDGSRVVDGLLPRRFRGAWAAFSAFGPMLLLLLIALPVILGAFSILDLLPEF